MPDPLPERRPIAESIAELAARIGVPAFVAVCVDLLEGAPRERYVAELRSLTGHGWAPGDPVLDHGAWKDHWVRSWGARGLLHVWHESATTAVVRGLDDEHHRPAETCLKVAARHDVAGAVVFLVWDLIAIGTRMYHRGASPAMSGVDLAPELPVEELVFIVFLCYLTMVLHQLALRLVAPRLPGRSAPVPQDVP